MCLQNVLAAIEEVLEVVDDALFGVLRDTVVPHKVPHVSDWWS